MRRNVRQEFRESMDSLHFSSEAKEEMTKMLRKTVAQQSASRRGGRKLMALALAAATLLITLTGAAVFTRWSRIAQNKYKPSEEIKEQADKSGLSTLLEDGKKETAPGEVLSVTDKGITVTAVQSIIDEYDAELIFRVEGFDLPEGKLPAAIPIVTIDGRSDYYSSMSGWFFDGTTRNEEGKWVYAENGKPVEIDANGTMILDYAAPDGSMEYTYHISFQKDFGSVNGKEINVKFNSFDVQSEEKAGMDIPAVEGNWELHWTLRSTSEALSITPNAPIGDSGVTLLTAQIGQKTIVAAYQLQEYWDGWEVMDSLHEGIQGVRMKDGSEYRCYPTTEGYKAKDTGAFVSPLQDGYEDMDKVVYYMEFTMVDAILDVNQVESLMFHKGWEKDASGKITAETFYYIPIA